MAIGLAGSQYELSHFKKLREFKYVIKASEKDERHRRKANAKSTRSKTKAKAQTKA